MGSVAARNLGNTFEWATPSDFFARIQERYGPFDLDPAATAANAKAPRFFTKEDNGLAQEWRGAVYCNPPYGRQGGRSVHGLFVLKAIEEFVARRSSLVARRPASALRTRHAMVQGRLGPRIGNRPVHGSPALQRRPLRRDFPIVPHHPGPSPPSPNGPGRSLGGCLPMIVVCPRCLRAAVGWPLARRDLCAPPTWAVCLRNPETVLSKLTDRDRAKLARHARKMAPGVQP